MNNPLTHIDKVLKTKEDMQSFVLITFILFVLFVKCYMVIAGPVANNAGNNQRNADIVKPVSHNNI